MSAAKPKTHVNLRLDPALCDVLTRTAKVEGVSRNTLINHLLLLAHEGLARTEQERAEHNKQRIIAAAQRGHLDAIEREGGVDDMREANERMYDLNDSLSEIRERREKNIRG